MSGSLNKVLLIGNLGNDPDVRTMQNGGRVVNLSIATSESWKDKNTGERQTKTEWHRVVIFNEGLVKVAENYLKKGSKVYIEGQVETRKWTDQSGVEKYTTEIVLRPYRGELTMLDSRNSGGGDEGGYGGGFSQNSGQSGGHSGGGFGGGASQGGSNQSQPQNQSTDSFEDDIPF